MCFVVCALLIVHSCSTSAGYQLALHSLAPAGRSTALKAGRDVELFVHMRLISQAVTSLRLSLNEVCFLPKMCFGRPFADS